MIRYYFRPVLFCMTLVLLLVQCSPRLSPSSGSDAGVRAKIIDDAVRAVGSKYKYGGTGNKGYDCSGLVYTVFKSHEYNLPRSTKDLIRYGKKIKEKDVRPGDLAFFTNVGRKVDHVAIVYKVDRDGIWLIHSTTSSGVITQNLERSTYWSKRLIQFNSVI